MLSRSWCESMRTQVLALAVPSTALATLEKFRLLSIVFGGDADVGAGCCASNKRSSGPLPHSTLLWASSRSKQTSNQIKCSSSSSPFLALYLASRKLVKD
jgi:hypothetical protein